MGSIAVTEAGHHFFNRMFGGVSAHHPPPAQDSTQVQHPPVRQAQAHDGPTPSLRGGAAVADSPMTDASTAVGSVAFSQPEPYTPTRSGASSAASHSRSQPPSASLPQTGHGTRSRNTSLSSQHSSRTLSGTEPPPQNRLQITSLQQISDLVSSGTMGTSTRRHRRDDSSTTTQYDISAMPVGDIIEMVAGILTKITSTNDRQHKHIHQQMNASQQGKNGAHNNQGVNSVLAFHGKNVPSISILNYLNRIHKYCPTTYEVFLSLLVYFDRMTERVNAGPMRSLRMAQEGERECADSQRNAQRNSQSNSQTRANAEAGASDEHRPQQSSSTSETTPPPSGSLGNPAGEVMGGSGTQPPSPPQQMDQSPLLTDPEHAFSLSQFFVVDSYNIHRLVIAGVTCASKFFSDVFYTNSRYAKVRTVTSAPFLHSSPTPWPFCFRY